MKHALSFTAFMLYSMIGYASEEIKNLLIASRADDRDDAPGRQDHTIGSQKQRCTQHERGQREFEQPQILHQVVSSAIPAEAPRRLSSKTKA